ncbi:MAG: 3-isopropylmalate dehydratase large subunit [Actinomycetota bacterium]|nr:3-isopropylmalate dehydratase large subunit [Actinomycetota bacterium]
MQPQTAVEKIISAHARGPVFAGELTTVSVDFVMAQDGNAPLAISLLRDELGSDKTFDPECVILVIDHCGPSPNEGASRMQQLMRAFARDSGARLFDVGEGISHVVLPEMGYARPGGLVVGSDSHSVTYGALNCLGTGMGSTDIAVIMQQGRTWLRVPETTRVVLTGGLPPGVVAKDLALEMIKRIGVEGATYDCLEVVGPGLAGLKMDARLTLCNMAVEMGAKCALMPVDAVTEEYCAQHNIPLDSAVGSDEDAVYKRTVEIDLASIRQLIAPPHDLTRIVELVDFPNVKIDMAFIGTCTNSRLTDLEAAADVLRGRRLAPGVRLVVTPGSRDVYLEAGRRGLIEVFVEAGGMVTPPGCGPCVGTHLGVPGDHEVVISTANRNFKGRMGNSRAEIYLASPPVVAASAVAGYITTAPASDAAPVA